MKTVLKITLGLVLLIIGLGAAIHLTGNTFNVIVAALKPGHDFDLEKKGPAPDYSDPASWAALPDKDDPADLVPQGVAKRTEAAAVDVFFVHPTGYLSGEDWNWTVDLATTTEESTSFMLSNQASVFNSCCNIYAPRYRQASIFAYFEGYDSELATKALGFAYADVERAFDHFLEVRGSDRPFILAGHSQGTHHATTLLKKRIAGTPLRSKLVAAYIIGGWIKHSDIDEMADIDVCNGPTDLHCVNHWVTWGQGADPSEFEIIVGGKTVCTNPLTWTSNEERAERSLSRGAVASVGAPSGSIFGESEATGTAFGPLGKPLPNHTWAECKGGNLIVEEQVDGLMGQSIMMPGTNNYHGFDYQLFHMDIRENAQLRVITYFAEPDFSPEPTE